SMSTRYFCRARWFSLMPCRATPTGSCQPPRWPRCVPRTLLREPDIPVIPLPFAADHPVFAGHFPGQPIVPGVLLLDWAQAAIEAELGQPVQALTEAKFHSPATPADVLELDFEVGPSAVRF